MPGQRAKVFCLGAVGALAANLLAGLEVRLRDARTGEWLEGVVELRPARAGGERPDRWRLQVFPQGKDVPLTSGSWRLRAEAPGYRPLEAELSVGAAMPQGATFLLEPASGWDTAAPPEGSADEAVIWGVVRAEENGAPLEGVRVVAEAAETRTDRAGRFLLRLPAEEPEPGRLPESVLELELPGRRPLRVTGVLRVPGVHRYEFFLAAGTTAIEERDEHRQTSAQLQEVPFNGEEGFDEGPGRTRAPEGVVLAPPASIRVGFANSACSSSCCGTSGSPCNFVCVFSLETYVARGLNDEWIASWNAASLRAGAVAYRSYGAYHVDHPRTSTYDLCSSACCQVNDPDTSSATDAAVQATAGILLERNGAAFRAEYSAENNGWDDPNDGLPCSNSDLSCGDGFVGSPAASWPCLADAVAAGHGCFGHGRGMSQWGTKRWGDAPNLKTWKWMADHYYNASGNPAGLRSAFLASPVDLQTLATCSQPLAPGGRFGIWAQGANLGSTPLGGLLFGASLKLGSSWVSNPPGDAPFSSPAGSFQVARSFDLDPSAAAGTYDLVGAFWLDVDGNGQITSADLLLDSLTVAASVPVSAAGALFAGCFESGDLAGWSAWAP